MGIEITISPLDETDIPSVVEIERQSQLEPWSEQSFLEELERLHSHMLAARLGRDAVTANRTWTAGEAAGYICYWCVADEIQILNIAVHPDFRRQGMAGALLAHAIERGREKKVMLVTLEVRRSNDAARRLYESFGFKVVGERPNYYGAPVESAILMELEILKNDV
ncbi:MAG: ribosomal protein S18-alanine N-acetyltransferase [Syntrophobacter sp.]